MRVLWLAADAPYPANYGKLVYSAGVSESLAGAGVDVLGLCLDGPGVAARSGGVVRWRPVGADRRSHFGSLASRLPALAHATAVPEFRRALAAALGEGPWDAVVVDHLEMGWAVFELEAAGSPIVYVAHNHESTVRREVARRSRGTIRRIALGVDARKAAWLEQRLVRRAALVTALTESDARQFEQDAPATRVLVVPPGYSGTRQSDRQIGPDTPRRATIVTSLDWHVKQANLEAFLEVADPLFERAGIELQVVGRAPEDYTRRLASSTNATVFIGTVDALDETLATARVGIVSEPLGGGFKLKTLDFVFHRVPIAVLEGSVDGVALEPGESVLEFADAESLVRGVIDVIDDFPRLNALHERAYTTCAADFDWHSRGEKLRDAISALPHTQGS